MQHHIHGFIHNGASILIDHGSTDLTERACRWRFILRMDGLYEEL
jgi:hypothetical protein